MDQTILPNKTSKRELNCRGMPGVNLTRLMRISDCRGEVRKMIIPHCKEDIGEVYFSIVNPKVVKAWHGHSKMTLNYACVYGAVQVGLCDLRTGKAFGKTAMINLDTNENYYLLTIPPGVWNGFRCHPTWDEPAIICNAASIPYSEIEITKIDILEFPIPFDWGVYEVGG